MKNTIMILASIFVLAGCQSNPTRQDRSSEGGDLPIAIGKKVDATALDGPDRVTVEKDTVAAQRAAMVRQFQKDMKLLRSHPDVIVTEYRSTSIKHPKVEVKYNGKPPTGIFDLNERLNTYRESYMDGDTIVYKSDLGQMTMIMERQKQGEPYDYRELTAVVPYAMCLDFIEENLGKEQNGYILRKIQCDQDNLDGSF